MCAMIYVNNHPVADDINRKITKFWAPLNIAPIMITENEKNSMPTQGVLNVG